MIATTPTSLYGFSVIATSRRGSYQNGHEALWFYECHNALWAVLFIANGGSWYKMYDIVLSKKQEYPVDTRCRLYQLNR